MQQETLLWSFSWKHKVEGLVLDGLVQGSVIVDELVMELQKRLLT